MPAPRINLNDKAELITMAKVGASIDPEELDYEIPAKLRRQTTPYGDRIIDGTIPPPDNSAAHAEWIASLNAAKLAWRHLTIWRRTRWTICAYRHGNPANEPTGVDGWSGWTLFWSCWRQQNIIAPHRPISPCARRVTDGGASPWDYTP